MRKVYWYLVLVSAVIATPQLAASAGTTLGECTSLTGNNAHVLVPAGVDVSIGSQAAEEGDALAVFTADGECAGLVRWGASARALTIWGDDSITPEKESFNAGEALRFGYWDASEGVAYWNVDVEFTTGDPFFREAASYAEDAVFVLEALTVSTDAALSLSSPLPDERAVTRSPRLEWTAIPDAASYELQVSSDSAFEGLEIDEAGLTESSFQLDELDELDEGSRYYWRVRAVLPEGPTPYLVSTFTTLSAHSLPLVQGWNMVSSRVAPSDSDMEDVFGEAASEVLLVKDGSGRMFYPEFEINTIGDWDVAQGYLVYARSPRSVTFLGDAAYHLDRLPLSAGWNMIAYWPATPMSVPAALESIADEVVLVKNGSGEVWLPEFDINTIGTMVPGAGYQVHVTEASDLVYPSDSESSGKAVASTNATSGSETTSHDVLQAAVSNNATLLVLAPDLSDGTVLRALTSNRSIGESIVENGRALIVLSGDDDFTADVVEGARAGDAIDLEVAGTQQGRRLRTNGFRSLLSGEQTAALAYGQDGAWVTEADLTQSNDGLPEAFELDQNYPNPFNPATTIGYALPDDAHVRLAVYNVLGQRVRVLVDAPQAAGRHEIQLHADDLPSGVYVYKITAGDHTAVRQMLLLK